MEAFLFSPSDIVIATFHVNSLEEVPAKFKELLANNPSLQVDSYIMASGRSWILTSIQPFQLRDGAIQTSETEKAAFTANAQYLAGADRGYTDMIVGAIFVVGGIAMIAFSVTAVRRISLWSVAIIVFGVIRIFRGMSKQTPN